MAIIVKTSNANQLLEHIKNAIEEKNIDTWNYTSGGYFTHSPEQWIFKAWFKPSIAPNGDLLFGIYPPKDGSISTSIYAVYHGRFIEMMLAHFDKEFTNIEATALMVAPDYLLK